MRLSTAQQPLPEATQAVLGSLKDVLEAGARAVDSVAKGTPGRDMVLSDQLEAWNV